MKKKEPRDLRLDPSQRLCPNFDECSIALHSVADPNEMGCGSWITAQRSILCNICDKLKCFIDFSCAK